MSTKFIALFLAGVSLGGCMTANSSVATSPAASAAPQAASATWDGLDEIPVVTGEPREEVRPKPKSARTRDVVARPPTDASSRSQKGSRPEDQWTRLPNEDPEADAKLARHLKICRDC